MNATTMTQPDLDPLHVRALLRGLARMALTRCTDTRPESSESPRVDLDGFMGSRACDRTAAEHAAWISADLGRCRGRVRVDPATGEWLIGAPIPLRRGEVRRLTAYQCAQRGVQS